MEKIHGTSCNIKYRKDLQELRFFSGGAKHDTFVALFDEPVLREAFEALGSEEVQVFGEGYGGKINGMRDTYGGSLRFVAFEVLMGHWWLSVQQAEEVVKSLGLEFVDYVKIRTTLKAIDEQRDRPSVQAVRNGMGDDKPREGIVLRTVIELHKNNGERIIAKHKREDFSERKTKQKVVSPERLKVLADAQEIADEWTTPMRLTHILDKFPNAGMEQTGQIIKAMVEDVTREAKGEIVETKEARKAIGKIAALLFKARLKEQLRENNE